MEPNCSVSKGATLRQESFRDKINAYLAAYYRAECGAKLSTGQMLMLLMLAALIFASVFIVNAFIRARFVDLVYKQK